MNEVARSLASRLANLLRAADRPLSMRREWVLWALLALAIVCPRLYLSHLMECYLWSGDAPSFCRPAFEWLNSGMWDSDPRRGPIYSLLIAGTLKIFGGLNALMAIQHVLGGISVLAGIGILRLLHGARSWLPLAVCGLAYAVYAGPISAEHLVRNETLLFTCATAALATWYLSLRTRHAFWFAASGISYALLTLTKDVFGPFPMVVIGGTILLHHLEKRKVILPLLVFCTAAGATLAVGHSERIFGLTKRPPEPQSGILLFGRVAQFTVLDGGIEPEIKALIRPDIESYRDYVKKERRLKNNIILKETAVPRMRDHLEMLGGSPSDLNRLCRRLAVEAISAHPGAYLRQVTGDFWQLNAKFCSWIRSPDIAAVRDSMELQEASKLAGANDPVNIASQRKLLENDGAFFLYHRIVDLAWLFQFAPVLLTSLILPVLAWRTRGLEERIFWVGCGIMWFFTLTLLSTVGRPMNRYMLPVTPVMFWTLGTAVIYGWLLARSWMVRR